MKGKRTTLLDRIAWLVTRFPLPIVILFILAAVVLGLQLPPPADPAPEKLLATEENVAIDLGEFQSRFQDSNKVLVLLVEADNVLAREPLQYLHTLARHFEGQHFVSEVLSLTTMPLPRIIEEDPGSLSLEDLEDQLPTDDPNSDATTDPEVLDALGALAESDPELFPGGFAELAARLDGGLVRLNAVVEGDEVTEDDIKELRDALEATSLYEGRLISRDRSVAVVILQLAGEIEYENVAEVIDGMREYIGTHEPPSGVKVQFGGLPYIRTSIVQNVRHDQRTLIPATLIVCMVLLYISFRWLAGVIMPLMAAGVVVLIQLGTMATLNEPMNIINNVIPIYLIIITITNSIHFIQRYRDAYRHTKDPIESRKIAVRSMGVAQLLTACTDAVGFIALTVSETIMLRRFGVIAGIGSLIPYVATIIFLAAALAWAKPPSADSKAEKAKAKPKKAGWLEVALVMTTRAVLRRSGLVIVIMLVALAGFSWVATHVNIDHALLDQFDEANDVYQSTKLMEDKLDGVRPLDVVITGGGDNVFLDPETIERLDSVASWARHQEGVLSTMNHSDVMHESLVLLADNQDVREQQFSNPELTRALHTLLTVRDPNPLAAYLSEDGRRAHIQIKLRDIGSKATLAFVDNLRNELGTVFPESSGFQYQLGGEAYVSSVGLKAVIKDLFLSLFMAIGIIFLILLIRFRSILLAALTIPPYLLPLTGTLAYMFLRGIPLNATTLIIFSISVGMAVNGSIHLLQRFQEEIEEGHTSGVALLRTARGQGRAILVAGVTLIIGFGVMMVSPFVPVRRFGELLAVTLGTCTLGTILIQPPLLKLAWIKKPKGRRSTMPPPAPANATEPESPRDAAAQ